MGQRDGWVSALGVLAFRVGIEFVCCCWPGRQTLGLQTGRCKTSLPLNLFVPDPCSLKPRPITKPFPDVAAPQSAEAILLLEEDKRMWYPDYAAL